MCLWLFTTSVHNTAQNSSDNLPSYLQTTIIAQMSIRGEGGYCPQCSHSTVHTTLLLYSTEQHSKYQVLLQQILCHQTLLCVPDSKVNVRQCICGCAWWLRDDVSLEQLSSLFTGAMSTCRRTLRLNIDALPLRRYSARKDVCDMTLWLRSGILHTHTHTHTNTSYWLSPAQTPLFYSCRLMCVKTILFNWSGC